MGCVYHILRWEKRSSDEHAAAVQQAQDLIAKLRDRSVSGQTSGAIPASGAEHRPCPQKCEERHSGSPALAVESQPLNNPQNLLSSRPDQTVVLIAEDEVTVQNVARIVLEKSGYFVLTASDGEEALTISRAYPGNIDVLLSDIKMPKMDGLELRQRILDDRPDIKIVLMSGQIEDPLVAGVAFLHKPFRPPVLRERIQQIVGPSR
jgi:CheY-like chemotaxis protein